MTYNRFLAEKTYPKGMKSATSDERFVRVRYITDVVMWFVRVTERRVRKVQLSVWATKSTCGLSA